MHIGLANESIAQGHILIEVLIGAYHLIIVLEFLTKFLNSSNTYNERVMLLEELPIWVIFLQVEKVVLRGHHRHIEHVVTDVEPGALIIFEGVYGLHERRASL